MSLTSKVQITYSPNPYEVGTVVELDRDEARVRVAEGRAVYVYDDPDPTVRDEPAQQSEPVPPARKAPRSVPKTPPANAATVDEPAAAAPQ